MNSLETQNIQLVPHSNHMSVSNKQGDSSIVKFNVLESTIMKKIGVDRIESNESSNTATG